MTLNYSDMTWEEFRKALIDFIGFEPRYPENARVKNKFAEACVSPWEYQWCYCYDENDRLLFAVNNGIIPWYGVENGAPFADFPNRFTLYACDSAGQWDREINFDYVRMEEKGMLLACQISPYRFDDQGKRLSFTADDVKYAWFKNVRPCQKNSSDS